MMTGDRPFRAPGGPSALPGARGGARTPLRTLLLLDVGPESDGNEPEAVEAAPRHPRDDGLLQEGLPAGAGFEQVRVGGHDGCHPQGPEAENLHARACEQLEVTLGFSIDGGPIVDAGVRCGIARMEGGAQHAGGSRTGRVYNS